MLFKLLEDDKGNSDATDIKSVAKGSLMKLRTNLAKNGKKVSDESTKFHYLDMLSRIDQALDLED